MSSLPAVCNARAVAAVCAQSAPFSDRRTFYARMAVKLRWTAPGGYPEVSRVRHALEIDETMSRRLAQRFLDAVGATDADYHTMVHQLECEQLDV